MKRNSRKEVLIKMLRVAPGIALGIALGGVLGIALGGMLGGEPGVPLGIALGRVWAWGRAGAGRGTGHGAGRGAGRGELVARAVGCVLVDQPLHPREHADIDPAAVPRYTVIRAIRSARASITAQS